MHSPETFVSLEEAAAHLKSPAAVLGTFDGVHVGHQALIRRAAAWARAHGVSTAVITFDPLPAAVLCPSQGRLPLMPLDRRLERFGELGADAAIVLPFTPELAAVEARTFVRECLLCRLAPSAVFVGENFSFGRGGLGNPSLLGELCAASGTHFEAAELFRLDGRPVSSTRIRECLLHGDALGAARMLGRPFSLSGKVVHGRARGRGLGFPTANIPIGSTFLPKDGVWAAAANAEGLPHALPAVLNLGTKPTFGEADMTLEAFLLGQTERLDLYGRFLSLDLIGHLRSEQRFPTPEALARQIAADCERAKALFEAMQSPLRTAPQISDAPQSVS